MKPSILTRAYRSPLLSWLRPLWRSSKWCCHQFVNRMLGGRKHSVGSVVVRVPSQYSGLWAKRHSEDAATDRFVKWLHEHPDGLLLDIGCEIGMYTMLALSAERGVRVVAFDSAWRSLQILRQCASFMNAAERVQVVQGFINKTGTGQTLEQATAQGKQKLDELDRAGGPVDLDYVNLGQTGTAEVTSNTLDDLFRGQQSFGAMLIKMDIEGAEGLALAGARDLLTRARPQLLISIHPQFLGGFGMSKDDLLKQLVELGYQGEMVSVDHEEHWRFEPR